MLAPRNPAMPSIGRADPGVAEVQLGVGQRGAGRGDLRLLRLDVGAAPSRAPPRACATLARAFWSAARAAATAARFARLFCTALSSSCWLTDPRCGQRRVAADVELGLLLGRLRLA